MTVVQTRFGAGEDTSAEGHAAVFSPVLPQWDEGRFCTQIIGWLRAAGYQVTVLDTLCLLDPWVIGVRDLAARWAVELDQFGPIDLLVGNALGGAVAQALLEIVSPLDGALLISSPTTVDGVLEQRLGAIAALAEQGDVPAAIALLRRRVSSEGTVDVSSRRGESTGAAAGYRLARGMRLLMGLDLVEDVLRFSGPLMHVVGAKSQLVTRAHVAGAAHHQIVTVEGAGMRPHVMYPALVGDIVRLFLRQKV